MPIESGLQSALQPLVSSLSVNSRAVCRLRADCSPLSTGILYFTESDDTRGCKADCSPLSTGILYFTESDNIRSCNNTICPPEDEQGAA